MWSLRHVFVLVLVLKRSLNPITFFFPFLCMAAGGGGLPLFAAYGNSQDRGQIGAASAGLCHSHAKSQPCLQTYTTAQSNPGSFMH